MKRNKPIDADLTAQALAPFKHAAWPALTPAERYLSGVALAKTDAAVPAHAAINPQPQKSS